LQAVVGVRPAARHAGPCVTGRQGPAAPCRRPATTDGTATWRRSTARVLGSPRTSSPGRRPTTVAIPTTGWPRRSHLAAWSSTSQVAAGRSTTESAPAGSAWIAATPSWAGPHRSRPAGWSSRTPPGSRWAPG